MVADLAAELVHQLVMLGLILANLWGDDVLFLLVRAAVNPVMFLRRSIILSEFRVGGTCFVSVFAPMDNTRLRITKASISSTATNVMVRRVKPENTSTVL